MQTKRNAVKLNDYIGNVVKVAISNLLRLISGILIGFLLPKVIDVTGYGYYKTFTLYASYVGLMGVGIVDGIYLFYGGKQYDDLEKTKFRLYSQVVIGIQILAGLTLLLVSLLFFRGEYRFIFSALSIYLIVGNVMGYYQIISQIVGRFTELANRNLVYSFLSVVAIIVLWVMSLILQENVSYRVFTSLYIAIFAFLAVWYIFSYRDITFGKKASIQSEKKTIFCFMKNGIPLMIANLCSMFVLTIDRQFVNVLFSTQEYAIYAFAYNMLAMINTLTGAVSVVLYPTLKKLDTDSLKANYAKLISVILSIVFLCLASYYPLCWIVDVFLPQYHNSLLILRIIFPGLAISSAITIVMHNYYKAMGATVTYFLISVGILILSAVFNLGAYLIWETTTVISIASVVTCFVWYFVAEHFIAKEYKIKRIKNFFYMIAMMAAFYLVTTIDQYAVGFIVYFVICVFGIVVFHSAAIKPMLCKSKE